VTSPTAHQPPLQVDAPRQPEEPQPHSFPLVASIAPVLGSLLVWAITRSPYALVFAALGPLIAVASVVDSRLQARRRSRKEGIRFAREIAECRVAIALCHDRERARIAGLVPLPAAILATPVSDPERWRVQSGDPLPVSIGVGSVASATRLGAEQPHQKNDDLAELRNQAARLEWAEVVVDARLGVGIVGPRALAESMARGILLQLANLLSPAEWRRSQPIADDWLGELPHPVDPILAHGDEVRWSSANESVTVAVADSVHTLPAECRIVVTVSGGTADFVRTAGLELTRRVQPVFLSDEEARRGARMLAAAAVARGMALKVVAGSGPTSFADLQELDAATGPLGAAVGWAASRPLAIDLVEHGPHAIVGGTTGSGKSELLVSWVLGMAAAHSPQEVTFLLVDLKGGSAVSPLIGLPHVVGLITDLDERSARRALASLTAELRFRERRLAAAKVRSIDEPGTGLARLVLVVDEFAAMVSGFPELHELFADLAARGRSLGMHLILCTQRPAGVVRDAVLANCGLRISLRVNNRADSVAVIGTGQAAELPPVPRGTAFVSIAGDDPVEAQVALSSPEDAVLVAQRWAGRHEPVRRPWCDELPRTLFVRELPSVSSGIPFGLLDLPERQSQPAAVYDPSADGNLLVIGGHGSGKTELLNTLAVPGAVEIVPSTPDGAWDRVSALVAELRVGGGSSVGRADAGLHPGAGRPLVLIDDLDALIARFSADHQAAFLDLLAELLRGGSASGLNVVIAVRRVVSALHSVVGLCDSRIVLRLPSRQDHLIAGGTATSFTSDAQAGSGEWKGSRLQVALSGQSPRRPVPVAVPMPTPTPTLELAGRRAVIAVSTRPQGFAARLRSASPDSEIVELAGASGAKAGLEILESGHPVVVVGDPQAWQSSWALLGALRSTATMVFDGCTVADVRAVTASRQLPPPLADAPGALWLLEPDGRFSRATAPDRGETD
jgi:S-DNA-T family DNA segregation ATPase FtsK/SpoIIIE